MPIDPENTEKPAGGIAEQTLQTLRNVEAILKAAESCKENVLKVTIYISDMALFGRVNEVYAAFFGDSHKPARSTVPIKQLPKDFLIEIEAVAFRGTGR